VVVPCVFVDLAVHRPSIVHNTPELISTATAPTRQDIDTTELNISSRIIREKAAKLETDQI
jgi:hypothetical protein